MLDVDGRVDVDAGGQQLLDVQLALGMAAARGVGVGELVDQHQLPAARCRMASRSISSSARPLYVDRRRRGTTSRPASSASVSAAAVRLDHADHDVDAVLLAAARGLQHLVGLADAGRGAEEDLSACRATLLARAAFEQGVGRGALSSVSRRGSGHRALDRLSARSASARRASSARLSSQHVDPRLADHAEDAAFDVLGRPAARTSVLRQTARLGDARHLEERGGRRDVRDRGRCAEVVTRSTGTGGIGFSALSLAASPLTRSISALRGRAEVASRPSWRRCRAPAPSWSGRSGRCRSSPTAGRGSSLSSAKFWPISSEPTTLPSLLDQAAVGLVAERRAWAMPVIASG